MTNLHIPDKAIAALFAMDHEAADSNEEAREYVDAITRPVLIAELRRIADKVDVPLTSDADGDEEEAYFEGKRNAAGYIRHVVKGLEAGR